MGAISKPLQRSTREQSPPESPFWRTTASTLPTELPRLLLHKTEGDGRFALAGQSFRASGLNILTLECVAWWTLYGASSSTLVYGDEVDPNVLNPNFIALARPLTDRSVRHVHRSPTRYQGATIKQQKESSADYYILDLLAFMYLSYSMRGHLIKVVL